GLDQRSAQYRGLNRHFHRFQRACPSRAVPSEPAGRKRDPVERPVSGHAAPGDELFRGSGQLASPGAATGHPMDWTAGADAGVVPGLHGRLLGPDADRAFGRAARACLAQSQTGRGGSDGTLIAMMWVAFTCMTRVNGARPQTVLGDVLRPDVLRPVTKPQDRSSA